MKKVMKIFFNILLWVVVLTAACVTIISLNTREEGIADVAGWIPLSVQTDSMYPAIKERDLIVTRKYDGETKLEVGDIITFKSMEEDGSVILKTHRIEAVNESAAGNMVAYVTRGDNVDMADEGETAPADIISVYAGVRIPGLGVILTFLKTRIGFFIFIILPLFAFFIYQLHSFIIVVVEAKKQELLSEKE